MVPKCESPMDRSVDTLIVHKPTAAREIGSKAMNTFIVKRNMRLLNSTEIGQTRHVGFKQL